MFFVLPSITMLVLLNFPVKALTENNDWCFRSILKILTDLINSLLYFKGKVYGYLVVEKVFLYTCSIKDKTHDAITFYKSVNAAFLCIVCEKVIKLSVQKNPNIKINS